MSTKAERLAFAKKIEHAIDIGDMKTVEDCFDPDFKMIVPGTGGRESKDFPMPPGRAGPMFIIDSWHKGLSNFHFKALKTIAEDDGGEDIVVSRCEFTGVHTGDFMGIPATGKHLVGRMTVWDRVVGGKIVSSDVFVDMAHLMIQMGVMEPPKLGPQ